MWIPYDRYLKDLFARDLNINHDTDTFKIALLSSAYTPNRAQVYFSEISANEVSGTGYTAGGNTVLNPTVTVASNTVTWDADDPATWSQSATGFSTARYAVLYKDTGSATTSPLVAYHDFGSDKGNSTGDFTVQFDAAGIATVS